ncbi:hypothetical protein F3Y22_tig00111769pilonHSYRG00590 [Hibiscus syriacus]|uniref:Remorin C-terminal domain-containing protein n=1 Tax=Hibiscus syriacus TaxID=106335 RepID=A0A6A2YDZ8_HIBSY|nr:hypothetical protein F3Y22_tig00111769pilonHSYRG00590 [Hibiscus syriacus]
MDFDSHHPFDSSNKELSEQDMKLKTRREIVALGVQLGKMNIVDWASKDEKEKACIGNNYKSACFFQAKVEQMRVQAQAQMVKKNSMTSQRTEEKRAAAEARKSRDARRTAAQVEYIRRTGRMLSSHRLISCVVVGCSNIAIHKKQN